MGSPLSELSNDQLTDIIEYLGPDDFKALRLAGNKSMCLSDPKLTGHLQLRMDKVPFFCENDIQFSEDFVRRWTDNRGRLVINDADANLSPSRVAYLVENGFMDSATDVIINDCHRHRAIIEVLAKLPNVQSLTLLQRGGHGEAIIYDLEAIVAHVGNMSSLTSLHIEFDTVVHGSRLSFLMGLQRLRELRLVGFDLSAGIRFVGGLTSIETLHLCHGNFFSSPDNDVNEKDLNDLIGLTNVKRLHLEGFDELNGVGLAPFSAHRSIQDLIFKHCQETSDQCLTPISRMTDLKSLHFVSSSCDDVEVFDTENLERLNTLSLLKSLSFFYALDDPSDLSSLPGLTSLETLNLAFEETMDDDEMEDLCTIALQVFPSLKKLRIFSDDSMGPGDGMDCDFQFAGLTVEQATFIFGDLVYLD
jgi:hypothetical protein